ncbi:DedA family protein [Kitasatospora sp. NPDC092286]|uniref:DedA family protein n=1 Tax=Kitasatospora sp. NPDC092286 TaxID=3364087 RepID=UPI003820C74E
MAFALDVTSGSSLLAAYGALAVLVVTFVEAGVPVVGFLVPGDTLLFPAGVLCASAPTAAEHHGPYLTLWQVLLCAAVGSVAGTQLGFVLGRHGGRALTARGRGPRLRTAVDRSEDLLHRYGRRRAIVLGRFLPMVRSVLGPLAGALRVPTRTFVLWQVVGGLLWTQGTVLAGFALGASFPQVGDYLLPVVLVLVVVSALPLLLSRHRRGGPPEPTAGPGPGPGTRPGKEPEPESRPEPEPEPRPGPGSRPRPGE